LVASPCPLANRKSSASTGVALLECPNRPSVLYQRGIYPPEDFKVVKKYGLNVLVTTDDEVKNYIKRIMGQLSRMHPARNSWHC